MSSAIASGYSTNRVALEQSQNLYRPISSVADGDTGFILWMEPPSHAHHKVMN
jgi:hypothetical protein